MANICEKCTHRNVCRYQEPCEECNQFAQEVVTQQDCQACAKATSAVIANLQKRIATDNNVGDKKQRFLLRENGDIVPLTNCQQWIPVTERLPESKVKILVYGGSIEIWHNGVKQPMPSIFTGYMRGLDEGWFAWESDDYIGNVTHWMPLPEPPKED